MLSLIHEDHLIAMNWDTGYIRSVLNEFMRALRDHSERIAVLEETIPRLTEKPYSEQLTEQLNNLKSGTADEFGKTQLRIAASEAAFDAKLQEVRTLVENESLAHLGEARRLITVELSNYQPTLSPSDPIVNSLTDQLGKLKREIDDNAKRVSRLTSEMDDRQTADPRPASADPGLGIRIPHLEKRVSDIEKMVYTFPRVEADLRTLQLQFPAV
jgi:chromosome segregation ATPase